MSLRMGIVSFALSAIAVGALVIGCKNKESAVPGTWTSASVTVTAKADKTFSGTMGPIAVAGKWKMDGDDVVFTPDTVGGQPIATVKAQLETMAAKMPQLKTQADDLDKPNVMKLSDDGKSMTTDKAKDTNSGPSTTLTKKE